MRRDVDMAAVLGHSRFLELGPTAQVAYLELLNESTPGGTVSPVVVDRILARTTHGAAALRELQDASLLDTEPADWAWWVRLPWIVDGAFAVDSAMWASR